jgi:hypothetical protein
MTPKERFSLSPIHRKIFKAAISTSGKRGENLACAGMRSNARYAK